MRQQVLSFVQCYKIYIYIAVNKSISKNVQNPNLILPYRIVHIFRFFVIIQYFQGVFENMYEDYWWGIGKECLKSHSHRIQSTNDTKSKSKETTTDINALQKKVRVQRVPQSQAATT